MSYAATSPYLSSKEDYPSVWRTCLSDAIQTKAWADLCVRFSWKNAIVLVESTAYSIGAAEYFTIAANRAGIKVTTIAIDNGGSTAKPRVREAMEEVRRSGVKIIFAPILSLIDALMDTAIEEKMFGKRSFDRRDVDETITVRKKYPSIEVKRNATYTITLPKNVRRGDPRIQGYVWNFVDSIAGIMDSKFASVSSGFLRFAEPLADFLVKFNQTKYKPHLDAAYATVEAAYIATNYSHPSHIANLNSLSQDFFGRDSSIYQQYSRRSELIIEENTLLPTAKKAIFAGYPTSMARAIICICELQNTFYKEHNRIATGLELPALLRSYKTPDSFGVPFSFNIDQEYSEGHMVLTNARNGDLLHVVGHWSNSSGFKGLKDKNMVWPDGTNRVPDDGIALENYIFNSYPLGIFIIIFTVILLIGLTLTAVGLYKFWSTPVFRLATPELLAMMLGGLFLLSISISSQVGRPSPIMCAMGTWPYYVGITFIYSPLIMKTYRVLHIFRSADQFKRSNFSTKKLIILTLILAFIPTLLATLRPIVSPPSDYRVSSPDGLRVEVKCIIRYYGLPWAQLGATVVQMLISTYLAWNTRNVPDGFNESRYVFISSYMMSTMGMLGLVVSYLVEPSNAGLAACFLAFSSLFSTATCWSLLFLPKLYIAIFKPEKNCLDLIKDQSSKHLMMDDMPMSAYDIDEQSLYEAPTVVGKDENAGED